ncbi:MAG: CPBP family intramembrane metalloprotease [Kiritimatiellae bacterium]|nr:CPBP family intramembrane metalloprotease [Kiritimatiellia bacterium]MCO5068583.1 CPBP family glutamic-type intramembrane protease [Kiritimatiellia bacterium]
MTKRPLPYLLLFLAVPLLLGPLLAPWLFLLLKKLSVHSFFSGLADERFERVTTRAVQFIALILVWPCLRGSGTVARVAPALRFSKARLRSFLYWALIGVAMIVVIYGVGFAVGNYSVAAKHRGSITLLTTPLAFIVGAILIGALEEYLFRGFIFGSLRSKFSFASAAIASSAFFSAIHFFRPRLPAPLEEVTWSSGFQLFPHMFALFVPTRDWDFAITLFFMAIALCALLMRHGHLYGIAGLHAGWVWALQSGAALFDQTVRHESFWFGWGDNAAQGALTALLAIVLAVYTWRIRHPAPRLDTPAPTP